MVSPFGFEASVKRHDAFSVIFQQCWTIEPSHFIVVIDICVFRVVGLQYVGIRRSVAYVLLPSYLLNMLLQVDG